MNKFVLPLVAVMTFVIAAESAQAGLFARCCKRASILNKCRKKCCPAPVCCVEPEPVCCVEPEPVCCPEPDSRCRLSRTSSRSCRLQASSGCGLLQTSSQKMLLFK